MDEQTIHFLEVYGCLLVYGSVHLGVARASSPQHSLTTSSKPWI
jgi:hypothetical protein